ncbi:hypothetical protein FB567DRAFT_567300 [Paraphoma chrysanthemicola]|uniref:DUF7580 domain-containing protein n=1 Tax=Paraphoma chrysanthemicola TaxID=798071 RepID=A0A8K0W295_9PLEO|nr:hypothetical protein FB567DRAFT_567300 [Paraphoma chrysanthemicola]
MSGLEVAGVVLGSLPLVISALEHYANGIQTAKRYWRYKSELRSLILQIDTERGIFINTLEQLLQGIVRIEHMKEFLSCPGGKVWQDAEGQLKERLRSSYEIYFGNVKGMARSLERMREKLALDPDGKPQFSDPNLFKQEYKRLKFSLSKSEYTEQLGELKNHNQALTRLTKQSLELEPSRSEAKTRSCPNFNALQSYARSLYETLRSGLGCTCDGHAVKLRLENRTQHAADEDELLENKPFRVIFTYHSPASASLWDWKEADVRWISDKPTCVPGQSCMQSTTFTTTKATRRVRFNQIQSVSNSNGTTVTIAQQQTTVAATVPTSPTPEQIMNLCQTITKLQQPQLHLCAGYLLDSLKRKCGIYPVEPLPCQNSQHTWAAYTLRQVLTKRANFGRRLMQYDKFRVAVDLASSVLQLYKTPWLTDEWSQDDVYFVHRPGAPLATIYQHPFIYRRFTTIVPSQPSVTQPPSRRVIRNQTLFTLGVLLIELLYGKPIEELQTAHDLDCQGTPGAVWCTAERLIDEEIAFEAGQLYSDAVRRCIRCDFNQKNSSLDDQDFQQAVFDGVVAPLEKTLSHFNGQE